ncbi:Os07g0565500, partial [Oryza sativa Japonica Group]
DTTTDHPLLSSQFVSSTPPASPPLVGEAAFPGGSDLEAARKLDGGASPEIPVYAKGVSVLMPGHDVPTFIAHPAPAPCPPERVQWPSHQPTPFAGSSSNPS